MLDFNSHRMAKNIVIVESPAKAKTIEKFLGNQFKVVSSFGHIVDLPSKELGVDVEKGFKPAYIVSSDKKDLVKRLKSLTDTADMVWLASDEDREGEAIAWHLAQTLKLNEDKTKRIVFNSITKSAIEKAIANPRGIDYNLVNAQQARRILDRLVGYELSPVLWKKIKSGLSAGRVQSVAVRLIVEKEREINEFAVSSSYKVSAIFLTSDQRVIKANLQQSWNSYDEAKAFLQKIASATFGIVDLEKKPARKYPAPPFTTSTLQQEAARKLNFSVSKTMTIAQRLYESGFITYMRTDSVNLSQEALDAAKTEIVNSFGEAYSKTRNYTSKSKGAQEAHEAIRPTDMSRHTTNTDKDQERLYDLIRKRTLASQMNDAELERTTIKIQPSSSNEVFIAKGEVIKFDGFLKVYLEGKDDEDDEENGILPNVAVGEKLSYNKVVATQRFSRPPSRYTEASLVKKLEELGIGRPSTYAPTISTIQHRGYIERSTFEGNKRTYSEITLQNNNITENLLSEITGADKGKLIPTDIGSVVTNFLVNHFETILDYNFTAHVEESFDNIATGEQNWKNMLDDFYQKFHPQVIDVEKNAIRGDGERILGVDPKTGRQLSVRIGRFGAMAQLGKNDDEQKPLFASLLPSMSIETVSFEQALQLFELPRKFSIYQGKEVEANIGKFGPYIRFGNTFISLDKGDDVFSITQSRVQEIIQEKQKADAPIGMYNGKDVCKGVGRFGPYLKWNDMFISVSKKYDFDNLSQEDITAIIDDKLKKEAEKVVRQWDEGIRIEKARWGRFNLIEGKTKIELSKDTKVDQLSLQDVQKMISEFNGKKTKKTKRKTS